MSTETKEQLPLNQVIRCRREKAGLSQRDLAVRMRCQRTYVSKIENGKCMPGIENLEVFARALGTTPWRMLKEAYVILYPEIERPAPN